MGAKLERWSGNDGRLRATLWRHPRASKTCLPQPPSRVNQNRASIPEPCSGWRSTTGAIKPSERRPRPVCHQFQFLDENAEREMFYIGVGAFVTDCTQRSTWSAAGFGAVAKTL